MLEYQNIWRDIANYLLTKLLKWDLTQSIISGMICPE